MSKKNNHKKPSFYELSKEEQAYYKYLGYASEYASFEEREKVKARFEKAFGYTPRDYRIYQLIVSNLQEGMMDLEEKLAEYAHDARSGWMKYLFEKCVRNEDSHLIIPQWAEERWVMNTPYNNLSESEKESDRDEARKILKIF